MFWLINHSTNQLTRRDRKKKKEKKKKAIKIEQEETEAKGKESEERIQPNGVTGGQEVSIGQCRGWLLPVGG